MTIYAIKFVKIDPPIIDWLALQKIFIKANALGHDVICLVGHLLCIHPKIIHQNFLKDTLEEDLHCVQSSLRKSLHLTTVQNLTTSRPWTAGMIL